ncbi:MAG: ATP-binding protein [Candidatus Eremiobacterota bacterium]
MAVVTCTFATLLCLAWILVQSDPVQPGTALVLLAVLTVALELNAVPVPGWGFMSCAAAPTLAIGLIPGLGPAPAAWILLAGVLMRIPSGQRTRLEWSLAGVLPGLAGLVAGSLFPAGRPVALAAALSVAVYVPLAVAVPMSLGARKPDSVGLRGPIWMQVLAVAWAGPALAFVTIAGPWNLLWLAAFLLGLQRVARLLLGQFQKAAERVQSLAQRDLRSLQSLTVTARDLSVASRELDDQTRERRLVQELTSSLSAATDVDQVIQVLLSVVSELIPCQTAVVFLNQPQGLVPASPHPPLAEGARHLVERCLATGRVAEGGFPPEPCAAALPLQCDGVLYVGRGSAGGFTSLERRFLLAVAGAGGLGLQSALRLHQQQQAVEQCAQAHARLRAWSDRLAYLLEAARSLASSLSPSDILERLQRLLQVTLPHRAGSLLTGQPPQERLIWPANFWTSRLQVWLIEHIQGMEPGQVEKPVGDSHCCFVVCPLVFDQETQGAVLLESPIPLQAEQLDVLSMLCCQASAALHRARLHEEVTGAQAQLVQSSKMAAVGQLAAGVAHELNTPLCATLVGIELARMSLEDPQRAEEHLEVAERAGSRGRDIIAKLLYYARDASRGRTEANLNDITRDTLELLGHQLRLDGVVLNTALSPDLPRVSVNCTEIQQVLTNLLLNARDAALEGSGRREILIGTAADSSMVSLRVSDFGPGLEPELQERIFEPFFSTKPVGRGTGLGLSVSREIVLRHGGRIDVVSQPGRGATFVVAIPRAG